MNNYLISSGQTWNAVGNGIPDHGVDAFTVYNNELYVGGGFSSVDGLNANCVAKWNGTSWSPVGIGMINRSINWHYTRVLSLADYNSELFAGGNFIDADSMPSNLISKWNGQSWSSVGSGLVASGLYPGVYSLAVYNGEIYAGGSFNFGGCHNIAKWNGINWSAVDIGANSTIRTLCVYNGELYAGGNFDSAGSVPAMRIAKWNGISWSTVGSGFNDNPSFYSYIMSIIVFNNEIYAAGHIDSAGSASIKNVAKWDGNNWLPVGAGLNNQINVLSIYYNEIYASGLFDSTGHNPISPYIAKWNGSTWINVDSGLNYFANALCTYNSDLFVGGGFTTAGNILANHIVRWNMPVGIKENPIISSIYIYPNPTIDNIFIESLTQNNKFELYDLAGQRLMSGVINSSMFELNLGRINKGIYFLITYINGFKTFNKIIKE